MTKDTGLVHTAPANVRSSDLAVPNMARSCSWCNRRHSRNKHGALGLGNLLAARGPPRICCTDH